MEEFEQPHRRMDEGRTVNVVRDRGRLEKRRVGRPRTWWRRRLIAYRLEKEEESLHKTNPRLPFK